MQLDLERLEGLDDRGLVFCLRFRLYSASVITLTLLHPIQSIPVQSWTFDQESVIRIGRSTDNHVILYSAVVSRHHVEIRKVDSGWEIVNLGANGTYLDGKRITQVPVEDGVIIRLARSGPNVQIHLGTRTVNDVHALLEEKKLGQRTKTPVDVSSTARTDIPGLDDHPPHSSLSGFASTSLPSETSSSNGTARVGAQVLPHLETAVGVDDVLTPPEETLQQLNLLPCCHQYVSSGHLFCLECGRPLRPIGLIDGYQIVKTLAQDELAITQLVWKAGRTFSLTLLAPEWVDQVDVVHAFEQEAQQLLQLNHAALPKFIEVSKQNGQPYLVMEPVYGRSLQDVIAVNGPLPQPITIALLLEICDVLDYLHRQVPPIVHQSLKPENLIQHSASVPTKLVLTGFTPGRHLVPCKTSTEYIAPEQQQGHASLTSDLYTIGLIAAYCLTGQLPRTFYAQREQGYRFYAEYLPGITPDLMMILRRLTNPQPDDRFASAKELKMALQEISSFLPTK